MTEKMTTSERYASACHASNLRCEADKGSAADILIAAGWSSSRLGAELMRLASEYDGTSKPRPVCHDGLVRMALKHKGTQKERETLAMAEAAKWLQNEKTLFLGRLKTLPAIIDKLTDQSAKWKIVNPRVFATVSIGHWLNQVCQKCHGIKFELIQNTPATSTKVCKACQGTGLTMTPYGADGRKMANYLDDCVSRAGQSIKRRF